MLRIEDYYTDAPSAGLITMLERPEVVNRLLNTLICNFKGFDFFKLKVDMHPVKEELEEYKNLNQGYLSMIQKLHVYYDGHQLALKRILRDINESVVCLFRDPFGNKAAVAGAGKIKNRKYYLLSCSL